MRQKVTIVADTKPTDWQEPRVLDAEVAQSTVIDAEVIPSVPVEGVETQSAMPEKVKILLPFLVGGLLAGGIGFGVALLPGYLNPSDSMAPVLATQIQLSEQIEAQSVRIKALQVEPNPVDFSGEVAALTGEVTAIRADLTALKIAQNDQMQILFQQIDILEKRPLAEGVSPLAIATYERELAQLRADIGQAANEAASKIEATKAAAEALESNAVKLSREGTVTSALNAIRVAVETGASYDAALADLDAVTDLEIPTSLSEHASKGVTSLSILQNQFPAVARVALKLVRQEQGPAEGENDVVAFFKAQLGVRSLKAKEGTSADAVLSRAQVAVDVSNLGVALSEIAALSDAGQGSLREWSQAVAQRLEVLAALQELSSTLTSN
jgi:hypothetical protein